MFVPHPLNAQIAVMRLQALMRLSQVQSRTLLARLLGFAAWDALTKAMTDLPTSPADRDLPPGLRSLRRDILQTRLLALGVTDLRVYEQINPFADCPRLTAGGFPALPAPALAQGQASGADHACLLATEVDSGNGTRTIEPQTAAGYFDLLGNFGWDPIDDSFMPSPKPGCPVFHLREGGGAPVPVFLFPEYAVPGDISDCRFRAFQHEVAAQVQAGTALLLMRGPCWREARFQPGSGQDNSYISIIGQVYRAGKFHWLPISEWIHSVSSFFHLNTGCDDNLDGKIWPAECADPYRSCAMIALAILAGSGGATAGREPEVRTVAGGWQIAHWPGE